MAYVVRHRTTGTVLTSCLDPYRARAIAASGEQWIVREDLNSRHCYWWVGRLRLGQAHPYDDEARARLDAERDRLVAAFSR